MWNDEFCKEIWKTLDTVPGRCTNECYKAYYNGNPYFIKKILIRPSETLDDVCNRIENTERISAHFANHGIKSVVAVSHDGSFTHQTSGELWVAYPWLDATPINTVNAELCYEAGALLGKMHNIPSPFQYENNILEFHYPDFSWIEGVNNSEGEHLLPFLNALSFIKQYADWGYSCALKKMKENISTLSHCDLHPRNLFRKENSLVLIDWELSGSSNPSMELFDVALNFCGFCDEQTNLHHFEEVIKGYFSEYTSPDEKTQNELSIGALAVLIIDHMSQNINCFISSGEQKHLKQAQRFLNQLNELRKQQSFFLHILGKYSTSQIN